MCHIPRHTIFGIILPIPSSTLSMSPLSSTWTCNHMLFFQALLSLLTLTHHQAGTYHAPMCPHILPFLTFPQPSLLLCCLSYLLWLSHLLLLPFPYLKSKPLSLLLLCPRSQHLFLLLWMLLPWLLLCHPSLLSLSLHLILPSHPHLCLLLLSPKLRPLFATQSILLLGLMHSPSPSLMSSPPWHHPIPSSLDPLTPPPPLLIMFFQPLPKAL